MSASKGSSVFLPRLILIASVVWVTLVTVSYFYEITVAPSASLCRGEDVTCVGSAVAFVSRGSHRYYSDAWDNLFNYTVPEGEAGDMGRRSSPIVPVLFWTVLMYGVFVLVARKISHPSQSGAKAGLLSEHVFLFSPAILVGLFSFVFLLVEWGWQSFYHFTEPTSHGGIFGAYIAILLSLLFVGLTAMVLGRRLRRWLFRDVMVEGVGDTLITFGLGATGLIALLFFCLLFAVASPVVVWILMLAVLGLCFKDVLAVVQAFVQRSIVVQTRWFGLEIWLTFALFAVLAHNALELIRPIPIGFDDLGLYMIIPKVLFERGSLISGVDSYAWGIVMSLGFTLFRSAPVAMFLSSVMGILSAMAVYAVVRSYTTWRGVSSGGKYALLASALFLTLPTIIFQSSKDMKFDLASLFFQLLALLVFLLWHGKAILSSPRLRWTGSDSTFAKATVDRQRSVVSESSEDTNLERNKNIKDKDANPTYHIPNTIYYISLVGLFLGMAFVTKYTALFMVVVLGGVVTYLLVKQIRAGSLGWRALGVWFVSLLLPLLPILPGIFSNIVSTHSIGLSSFRVGSYQGPTLPIDPPLDVGTETVDAPASSGMYEELGRYMGYGGWSDYLQLPFTVTFNPLTEGIYVDIGFLFLALVPLLIFLPALRGEQWQAASGKRQEGSHPSPFRILVGMGVAYWILWAAFAHGVIWYGYGGFIFLILGVVEVLITFSVFRWGRYILYAFTALWLANTVVIRSAYLPDAQLSMNRIGMEYARGSVSTNPETGENEVFTGETFMQQWIPTYVTIRDTVNAAIKADPTVNVYRVGTFTKYFIYDSFAHALDDNQLDVFASASADHDDAKTIQRFKNGHFKYLIIDTNTATIDHTPEKSLTKKYNALIDFVYRNPEKLKIILNDTGVMLVEIK